MLKVADSSCADSDSVSERNFKYSNCQLQELQHLSLPTVVRLRSALLYTAYWKQALCELPQIQVSKMTSLPVGELQLRAMSLHDV